MKTGIIAALISVFLLSTLLLLSTVNYTKPRILVLHSSGKDASSVKQMDAGIHEALDNNRQPITTRWNYLEIDSLPDEKHRLEEGIEGRRGVDQFDPDVIIAADDEAQAYVARYYVGKTRPKIVYAGIDHTPQTYGYLGAINVTGVGETLPLTAIREAVSALYPGQPARVAVLTMPGQTGEGQMQQVTHFNWAPLQLVNHQVLPDFPAWQHAIGDLDSKADVVLVLSYDGVHISSTDKTAINTHALISWVEQHSKALPIGVSTAYVDDGGALSISPSPQALGKIAGEQALTWLKATPSVNPPPVMFNTEYRVAMRAAELKAHHVTLPSIYVASAQLDELYRP
jgi:hypothetical protein